jgi:predicted nucleotidyltransferase
MSTQQVNRFLNEFTDWARARSDISALALVGSYARNTPHESSDVDLVLITAHPDRYLKDPGWINYFGHVDRWQIEDYGRLTSLRVWYKGGPEVEFGITDESWAALPLDEGTRQVISGGIRVLFERGNILSRHQAAA